VEVASNLLEGVEVCAAPSADEGDDFILHLIRRF
jgi:hypothetical protein